MTKAAAKTKLPDDFELTPARESWARVHAPGVDVRAEYAEFRDYALSRDWRMVDWEATWRNWLRKAQKRLPAWKTRREPSRAPVPEAKPDTSVQLSPIRAFCNRALYRALVKAGGVEEPVLQRMIAAKNQVADAWEPYPDDITAAELRDKVNEALRSAYRPAARSSATP